MARPKGALKSTLTNQEWGKKLAQMPQGVERFRSAGEQALLSIVEGRSNLKRTHGILQVLRYWWLGVMPIEAVAVRLKEYGVDADLSAVNRGSREESRDEEARSWKRR